MPTISQSDLVAALLKAAGQDADDRKPKPKDIQARVLTDALREWVEPCPFERGDLVVVRAKGDGAGPGAWNDAGYVFIVASRLPPTSPIAMAADGDDVVARVFDMLLLMMSPQGNLALLRAESRHFTKYTGEVA